MRRASALSTPYNAGPVRRRRGSGAFERIGITHVPVGTGNSERLLLAIEPLRPDAVVLTPSYAAYLLELGDRAASSVAPGPGRGRARRRRAGLPREARGGWGARVTEAMGIGDIGSRSGASAEQQDGMHLGARGFVHAELIDPDTGEARPLRGRRRRASSCSPTCGTGRRRCSASARATTSSRARAPVLADVRRRGFAASGARTTC